MKEKIEEEEDYDPHFDGKAKSLQEICYRCGLGGKAMVKWIKNYVPGVVYTDTRKRLYSYNEVLMIAVEFEGIDKKSIVKKKLKN